MAMRSGKQLGRMLAGATLALGSTLGAAAFGGCAATEYPVEGPGRPSDRATGTVPEGSLGACRRPQTKRPPLVPERLWEDTKPCTSKTPATFVRLGYGSAESEGEIDGLVKRLTDVLKDAQDREKGNAALLQVVRAIKDYAPKDELLRRRASKHSSLPYSCDLTYFLNTTKPTRATLASGERCTASVFDTKARTETCLFDSASNAEIEWLTSSWDCTAHTSALGEAQSCHRLCNYDDYCARQVGCASADMDLLLCTLGVCLPEARAGF